MGVEFPSSNPARSISTLTRRYPKQILAAFLLCICFYLLSSHPADLPSSPVSHFQSYAKITHSTPGSQEAFDFWREFLKILDKAKPSFDEVKRTEDRSPWIFYDALKQESVRPDLLKLSKAEFEELKQKHKDTSAAFEQLSTRLPFVRGTRGIVTTASNDALPILTTSLWVLRTAGSTLPVEIWFSDRKDFQEEPCQRIYPPLGAKCMFMSDFLPDDLENPLHLVKFTYKTMSLMFSTFEQILFLDCDAFPVENPDSIFLTEPFTSAGWVVWPDYWASTASHYLYEMMGWEEPDLKERATTESGVILMNKSSHAAALLLVQMFNMYGPEHWHRIFSQAAPGEGDKDTYVAAARVYNLPWYQVAHPPHHIGYRCAPLKHPVGTTHSHPFDDWSRTSDGIMPQEDGVDLTEAPAPRILFVHGNLPKYDPVTFLDWDIPEMEWQDLLRCDKGKGKEHRIWGSKEHTIAKYGWDVEKAVWDGMRWQACEHERGYKDWIEGSLFRPHPRKNICRDMKKQWEAIFPNERWAPTVPKPGLRTERPWGGFRRPQ